MMRVVVDSNVLVKWFIPEKYSDCAKKIRDDHIRGYVNVAVPAYALLEFSNTLRKYVNRGILAPAEATLALNLLFESKVMFVEITDERLTKALEYGMRNHVTVYDACYLIIAQELNTEFYTADEKLLRKLTSLKEHRARHVCDYVKPQ